MLRYRSTIRRSRSACSTTKWPLRSLGTQPREAEVVLRVVGQVQVRRDRQRVGHAVAAERAQEVEHEGLAHDLVHHDRARAARRAEDRDDEIALRILHTADEYVPQAVLQEIMPIPVSQIHNHL